MNTLSSFEVETVGEGSIISFDTRRIKCLRDSNDDDVAEGGLERQLVDKLSLNNVLNSMKIAPEKRQNTNEENVKILPPSEIFEGIGRKMTPVTSDGGLMKLITVYGYEDGLISETDFVTFNYSGWLNGNAEPFTSSYFQRKKVERQIGGPGPVFIGLDIALISMKIGEVAFFLSCPAFSYGINGSQAEGNWPEIKPDDWILWKIEIVSVIDCRDHVADIFELQPDDRLKMPFPEILLAADTQRQLGLDAFKSQHFRNAKKHFEKAAKLLVEPRILPENDAVTKRSLLSKLFCNIALTAYKLNSSMPEAERDYEDVYENAASATNFDESNVRAWYWGGLALRKMRRLEKSREFLSKAARLDPHNSDIGNEIRALEADFKKLKEDENALLKRMVGTEKSGSVIQKIPASVEQNVTSQFREFVCAQMDLIESANSDILQFDQGLLNHSEITYLNAAILCRVDEKKLKISRFKSELGSSVIQIEKL